MKSHRIIVPTKLRLTSSIGFAKRLQSLPNAEEYEFDFQGLNWMEPFAMLYLSNEIRKCKSQHKASCFCARGFQNRTYEAHMGFFQAFGLDFGKRPGEAKGSDTYLPVTFLEVNQLEEEAAAEDIKVIGEIIEKRSHKLAEVLTQQSGGALVDTLAYSLREVIRNVVEHSESAKFGYCAQYWPADQRVEIAILDTGIGMRKTISENPYLQVNNDRDALNLSLMPGVSGKTYKGKRKNPYDAWANSGYGLYVTSRLCSSEGSFFICSGDTGLLLEGSKRQYLETNFRGTVLRLVLRTDRIKELGRSLRRILKEGDAIAKQFNNEEYLTASLTPHVLSRDFEER